MIQDKTFVSYKVSCPKPNWEIEFDAFQTKFPKVTKYYENKFVFEFGTLS